MAISSVSDISDLAFDFDPHGSDVYQDSAGTTPAGDGDPIGYVSEPNGYTLTQTTTTRRPLRYLDGNGWYAADFDDTDDYLTNASFDAGSQPFTLAAVAQQDAVTNNGTFIGDGSTNNFMLQTGTGPRMFWGNSINATTSPGTTRHVWLAGVNGASSWADEDGTEVLTGDSGSNAWTAGVSIGRNPNDATVFNGKIYRVLVYTKLLSSTERTDLATYLDSLYSSAPPSGGGFVDNTTPILMQLLGF